MRKFDFHAFYLNHNPKTEEWEVVLEDPDNSNNFICIYKNHNFDDCDMICSSSNNLITKHVKKFLHSVERDIINETADD